MTVLAGVVARWVGSGLTYLGWCVSGLGVVHVLTSRFRCVMPIAVCAFDARVVAFI